MMLAKLHALRMDQASITCVAQIYPKSLPTQQYQLLETLPRYLDDIVFVDDEKCSKKKCCRSISYALLQESQINFSK